MSEFHFICGSGRGKVPAKDARKTARIARANGATFVVASIPGEGPRHWFAARAYGHPFDEALAQAVREDLRAAGVVLP